MTRKNYAYFMAMPENEFSVTCLKGAVSAARDIDANLFVMPHGLIDGSFSDHESNRYRYQMNVLSAFFSSGIFDGAVVEYGTIVSDTTEARKAEFRSRFGDLPVVLMSEDAPGFRSVCFDNEAGLKEIYEHLVKIHGCRKIGFFSGPADNHDAQARLGVHREMVEKYDLPVDDDWIGYGNFSPYCDEELKNLIGRHPDMEALVFANDAMAECAYRILPEMGIKIGSDLLITGFDDSQSAILQSPPLTSVKADPAEMAYRAVMILDGRVSASEKVFIPSHGVFRLSCGCERKAVRDENGNIVGCETDLEFDTIARNRIRMAEEGQRALGEQNFILREVVFSHESEGNWIEPLLKSLKRLGAEAGYMFFYDSAILHDEDEEWQVPGSIYLKASIEGDDLNVFEQDECPCDLDTFTGLMKYKAGERGDTVVLPLFYRNRQFGFLCVRAPYETFNYIYGMSGLISNTIQMAGIMHESRTIQDQLVMASQAKTHFLANMSHEIRTPINAIMGMDEMILREGQAPEIIEYAGEIKTAAKSLLFLVNGILDLTKIEEGKMELFPVEYKVEDMIGEVMTQVFYRLGDKRLELKCDLDNEIPSKLYGDDNRIRQILINLMTNAVKYTETGSVTLKVACKKADDRAVLEFSVADTGIGIKEEDLGKLFEEFERIDERRNRNIEGVGLGINITVGLLELMGSKLEVQSVYNEGSVFSFTITQKIIDKATIGEKHKEEVAKENAARPRYLQDFRSPESKILVVDDNAVNRKVIVNLLKTTQIQTAQAENGAACLEKMKEDKFDLVLLDHMMPVMDGMQTLEQIKSDPEYRPGHPTVIVLTANAIKGVEREYLDSGFDGYLSKPVSPAKLEEVLLQYLDKNKIIYL